VVVVVGFRSCELDQWKPDQLLAMKLGDLREQRGIPREGIVSGQAGKAAFKSTPRSAEA